MSDETPAERVSRFREHTNTNSSIRPPPDELWKDLDIEVLIDNFNDENDKTPAVRKAGHPRQIMSPTGTRAESSAAAARKSSDSAATAATAEGTFGRFSRVFASVFGGVLGKRKAGHSDAEPSVTAEQARLDERKRHAEEAYYTAKEQGLLPAPKVFVRPGMTPRAWSADTPSRSRPRPPLTPRTPGSIVRSPSKKDLNKQKKLSKRVSSLEVKLASAKKELQSVLGNECFPAVPPFPQHIVSTNTHTRVSPTPNTPHVLDDDAVPLSPSGGAFADGASASIPGRITKRRKTIALVDDNDDDDDDDDDDMDYVATTTVIANDMGMNTSDAEPEFLVSPEPERQHTIKRVRSDASKRLKRTGSRLSRKVSRNSVKDTEKDEKIVVVRPGGTVPPVPVVPQGVEGNKVMVVGDDGYGGLGHEIF